MHCTLVCKAYLRRFMVQTDCVLNTVSDAIIGTVLEKYKDIVLITGGASGLGEKLVQEFYNKGVQKIVVFDIILPEEKDRVGGVSYYKCDVSDKDEVVAMSEKVKNEIGIVSVIVNNAAVTSGKSLIDLSYNEIDKIIKVNLMSSFYINKAFLPDMIETKRGYIVTIASVLGYMSPSNLAAYGASKSGLIALHESMTYELGPPIFNSSGIKTLLVCPGQLQTQLFSGVVTPSSILAPELDPQVLAQRIVRAIVVGKRGQINTPIYGNFLPLFRSSPWPITQAVRLISGIDESMNSYKNE